MKNIDQRGSGGGRAQVGRLGGCLWLVLAALGFLFIITAMAVGVDASFLALPIALAPAVLAILLFSIGDRPAVLLLSTIAGLAYAVLGIWNAFQAEAFERANPGADDISSGAVSLTFVLLTLAIASWSGVAALIARRRGR